MLLGDFAVSPLGWRYAPLVPALAVVALFALACGEEEVTVTPAPTPTIIQGTKPENPDEPQNPQPIDTGPAPSPRSCPECFAKPFPKPPPGPPCQQQPIRNAQEVDFASIPAAPTDGWLEYKSPNYELGFKYPPGWRLDTFYNDVYSWAGEDGILDERVQGPISETLTLYNPTAATVVGNARADFPPGAVKIDIGYGPIPATTCEAPSSGNPKSFDISLDGINADGSISVSEPPNKAPIYSLSVIVYPKDGGQMVFAGNSFGDNSNLSVLKAVLGTIGLPG